MTIATGTSSEVRLRTDEPEELEAVGDRHPHVEDDGLGLNGVRELEACLGGEGSGDPESLQLEHSGEGIGHGPVVVHDQDRPGG